MVPSVAYPCAMPIPKPNFVAQLTPFFSQCADSLSHFKGHEDGLDCRVLDRHWIVALGVRSRSFPTLRRATAICDNSRPSPIVARALASSPLPIRQQTATSEVLQTISGSPGDVQPVFDTTLGSTAIQQLHEPSVAAAISVAPSGGLLAKDASRRSFSRLMNATSSSNLARGENSSSSQAVGMRTGSSLRMTSSRSRSRTAAW
jgi:hypothetical protein